SAPPRYFLVSPASAGSADAWSTTHTRLPPRRSRTSVYERPRPRYHVVTIVVLPNVDRGHARESGLERPPGDSTGLRCQPSKAMAELVVTTPEQKERRHVRGP